MVRYPVEEQWNAQNTETEKTHVHILWQEHQFLSRGGKSVKLFSRKEIEKFKFTYSSRNFLKHCDKYDFVWLFTYVFN